MSNVGKIIGTLFPVERREAFRLLASEFSAEQIQTSADILKTLDPKTLKAGSRLESGEIFIGFYNPRSSQISSKFNRNNTIGLFAAPEDLRINGGGAFAFNKAQESLRFIKNYFDRDAQNISPQKETPYIAELSKILRNLKDGEETGYFIGKRGMMGCLLRLSFQKNADKDDLGISKRGPYLTSNPLHGPLFGSSKHSSVVIKFPKHTFYYDLDGGGGAFFRPMFAHKFASPEAV